MAVTLSGMNLYTNNDNEGNWAGTDGPDTYFNSVQGTNAESWNVAKNNTETGTLTLTPATAPDATRGLFVFWMASNLAPYYTDIRLELQSSTNNFKQFVCTTAATKEIDGVFVPTVVDYVNKGTSTGTYAPASHTVTRIIVDNSSSGNIRAVINNWIDVMYFGAGHTIAGTTDTDKLFTEAFNVDNLVANKYGILQNKSGVIFSQGDLSLTGTGTSDSETLVFIDTTNGYDIYNLDVTGSYTFINTSISDSGAISFDFDTSGATAFSMTGGSLTGYNTIATAASQTMQGIVFQSGGTATFANTVNESSFNQCGAITFTGSGKLTNCAINGHTAPVTVTTPSALENQVKDCTFTSSGTDGYAIDLGTIDVSAGDVTVQWYNDNAGYTTNQTTNATILVNVTGGGTNKLIINVNTGYTTPTVNNVGSGGAGDVLIQEGQVTLTLTDLPNGVEVRFRQGTFTLQHTQNVTGNSVSYTYTGTPKVTITAGGVGDDTIAYDRRILRDFTLPATSQSLPFELTPSSSYE